MKMLGIITAACCILFAAKPGASAGNAQSVSGAGTQQTEIGSDNHIILDKTKGGKRFVTATTSSAVCSKQVDIQIDVKTHKIVSCKFTGGCPGNTLGVSKLIEGITTEEAIRKLRGIPCGDRPTSCPDQLARILEKLKW